MDKETLSNYGWIVICVLVMVVMIALATPFGNFIADAVKSTTQGLFDTNQNALDSAGITIADNAFVEGNADVNDDYNHNAPELHPDGTIPEGAYYANLNTGTFYAEMPATVSDGDIYLCGDYIYGYNSSIDGWGVQLATIDLGILNYVPNYQCVDRTQKTYDAVLESINGKPIVWMPGTFNDCINLEQAPAIPCTVRDMERTFDGCIKLSIAPIIPNGVTNMHQTFCDCASLKKAPIIPSDVTNMYQTFNGCEQMAISPTIPSKVMNIDGLFYRCSSLSGIVKIDANPDVYDGCFLEIDMSKITLTGNSTMLNEIGATGNNWTPIS